MTSSQLASRVLAAVFVLCCVTDIVRADSYAQMMEWYRNDYYGSLGLDKTASQSEIRKVFRRLTKEFHPDNNPAGEARFIEINKAYEVIGNPKSRQKYDDAIASIPAMFRPTYNSQHTDVRIIIVGIFAAVSFLQWVSGNQRYNSLRQGLRRQPWFKNRVQRCMQDANLAEEDAENFVIRDSVHVRGGLEKPKVYHMFFIQFWFFPYYFMEWLAASLKWHWKFTIRREKITKEDEEEIMASRMYMSAEELRTVKAKFEHKANLRKSRGYRK